MSYDRLISVDRVRCFDTKQAPRAVVAARTMLSFIPDHRDALPALGLEAFRRGSQGATFGTSSSAILQGRLITMQTAGWLHALDIAQRYLIAGRRMYVPTTCPDVATFCRARGVDVCEYADIEIAATKATCGSIMVVRDGDADGVIDWSYIVTLFHQRDITPLFDLCATGFLSADLLCGTERLRQMIDHEMAMIVVQSFDASMGLMPGRVGALHVVTGTRAAALAVENRLERLGRLPAEDWREAMVAGVVLTTPLLFTEWRRELREWAERGAGFTTCMNDS